MLHAARDELVRRIETDPTTPPAQWRFDHLDDYEAARSWHSQEAHVIETTSLAPHEVAKIVAAQADRTRQRRPDGIPPNRPHPGVS
ncbi:hypothetical protein [Nocardia abscessus]|uniref:hypothetical protein n=1 Tax=Nocardia abscessus TaxID=120957 RepID=UPI002458AAAE|nr:hypothetical protein [Nocardia abscessus]